MSRASKRGSTAGLGAAELRDLDEALIAVYAELGRLRERYPAASRIARPGIPAAFSESLVAIAAPALFGAGSRAVPGGREADLRITSAEGEELLAEVKASGCHGWQEIKPRDLIRNYFVWVAFGERYELGHGAIEVHLLRDPFRYAPPRRKLTLPIFLAGACELEGFRQVRFASVERMLEGRPEG